jgi:ComF family protein
MRQWVDRNVGRLGGFLLPPRCVLCGARGRPPCLDLCAGCERSLPVADVACIAGPWPLQRSFAPFAYGYPLDHLVQALKYRGQLSVARVLGGLLAQRIEASVPGLAIDVLVPVPLHRRRHAERGFNQSREIARWVARRLRHPVGESVAVRCRDTRPQVGLRAEERRRNLAGAFAALPGVRGLRVAIVDDVYTTGATLRELGQALHDAGARSVEAWCVGRAPAPKEID